MNCPKCQDDQPIIIETRPKQYGVRRRRECIVCGHRWSTIEMDAERCKLLLAQEKTTQAFVKELGNLKTKGTK